MRYVTSVLIAISTVGILGIPLGDPKFLSEAIVLEASFVTLTALSTVRLRYVFIPNFIIAGIVIIGNTVSPTHTEIMLSFTPLYNAIILIIGGYVLQSLLVIATFMEYNKTKYIANKRVGLI